MQQRRTRFHPNFFLFVSLLALGLFIFRSQPDIALWIVGLLIILGLLIFVVSLIGIGKYQNVFDYEPTKLLGRTTTGKQLRSVLKMTAMMGGWMILIALILLMGK